VAVGTASGAASASFVAVLRTIVLEPTVVERGCSKVTSISPMWRVATSGRPAQSPCSTRPLTVVPLNESRSSMVNPSGPRTTRAWLRDTLGSSMTTSLLTSRPRVVTVLTRGTTPPGSPPRRSCGAANESTSAPLRKVPQCRQYG
jgi:hypothetical protein